MRQDNNAAVTCSYSNTTIKYIPAHYSNAMDGTNPNDGLEKTPKNAVALAEGRTPEQAREMRRRRMWDDLSPEEKIERKPELVRQARDHVSKSDLPGTPDLSHARILQEIGLPEWCGSRKVLGLSITRGDPQHGAKRSDDHVGLFEVEAPLSEIEDVPDVCPECDPGIGTERGRYRYQATHFIAGSETVFCTNCEEVLYSEDWG